MELDTNEEEVVARIVRWADTQDAIRLVLLESSRANPDAPLDVLSDYDVSLVVSDGAPFVGNSDWLRAVGTPLLRVRDSEQMMGVEKHNCMVLYEDGTKIDFGIWPLALVERSREAGRLPGEFDSGYRILLDKDGMAGALPPPSHTAYLPRRPTRDEYQSLIEEFWFVTTYVAKYLWRDELVPVKTIFDYELKYLVLLKLFEWRIGIDYDWSVKPGFFGRGLERYLDAATWAQFEETFVGPDRPANWTALYKTIDLFRQVATSVGEALGFTYLQDVDTKMMAYLRQIEQLGDTPPRDGRG